MLKIIALSLLLSVDALSFGLSFGLKKIGLPLKALVLICGIGFLITLGAISLGELMYSLLPFGRFLGGIILIFMGIYLALDIKGRNSIKTMLSFPEKTDFNRNGVIETGEAAAIGIALSLDSCTVVIGTAYLGVMLPVVIMLFQVVFLALGIIMGKRLNRNIKGKYVSLVCGLAIVVMGFLQLKG